MTLEPALGPVLNALGGLAVLALAMVVAWVRPRRLRNAAFGAFGVGFGLAAVGVNVYWMSHPADALGAFGLAVGGLALVAAALSLLALVVLYAQPSRSRRRALLSSAALLAALHLGLQGAAGGLQTVGHLVGGPFAGTPAAPVAAWNAGTQVFNAAVLAALLLLAVEFRSPASGHRRPALALMTVALSLWTAAVAGLVVLAGRDLRNLSSLATLLGLGLVAGLWLANTRQPDLGRMARNVALAILGAALFGMLSVVLSGDVRSAVTNGVFGVVRFLTAGLLAYAILRHQLLGLDVKVRWTVKQSTVAAAFIGVFFVVSESASSFLATEGGLGTYLGIAAAGMLVFAIAPLQRAAERVASTAMSGVRAVPEMSAGDRRAAYLEAARAAWADGAITKDERTMLRSLQRHFALSDEEAHRLEREAEGP